MGRVTHFEIHAKDPERAIRFWTEAFGWSFEKWVGPHDYWIIRTGPGKDAGIDGGMAYRHGPQPQEGQPTNGAICTLGVDSLEGASERIIRAGGRITIQKFPIHHVGWLSYFRDTEGNLFGIMQRDQEAREIEE